MTIGERFWSKVTVAAEDECWPWNAGRDGRGYGRFMLNGKNQRAHRVALMLHGRVEPFDGAAALHSCDNTWCVNPAHLRWGTQANNMQDRSSRARCGLSSITPEDVRRIRASRLTQCQLAARYGVSQTAIHKIRAGKSWGHVL